ncbi:hypothetical protein [Sphingobacterium spiritivorum]|uniref:hypothetical protein n=1 Tax=Sphingobacterium spiritivorum TaxID=258 RepID=UPI0019181D80|nr:hypothetical protein [Sphingobacterium spiritivorum]QQT25999.1 hypothetical protein I6J02_20220 [Sphingobacterium spiritivorum]
MSTQENTGLTVLEKIKSIAIALVGTGMTVKGFTYFTPQLSYDIPRILIPVYKILGPVGLAVAMTILGLLLLIWSYSLWKKNSGKGISWIILISVLILSIVAIIITVSNKNSSMPASNVPVSSQPTANSVATGDMEVVFPPVFGEDAKQQYEQLIQELEDAIASRDAGKSWSAYNRVNVFVARLKTDQTDHKQLDFIVTQTKRMDKYNQQIKEF